MAPGVQSTRMKKQSKKITVFYHEGCSDGFGAAWAAWKKFGSSADYKAAYHNDDPEESMQRKDVYLLDLCFRPETIEKIKSVAKSVTIIDHHKSSADWVQLATVPVFDLKHSGAVLSWTYFHPKTKVPSLLLTVEDIDLWNWKRAYTDEVMEYSSIVPMEFKAWSAFAKKLDDAKQKKEIVKIGKVLVQDREMHVTKLVGLGSEAVIDGHKALIVNSPVTIDHTSKRIYEGLTGAPASKHPVAIIWSRRPDKIVVSLRSNPSVDVSLIAKKFGGGGHPRSAAFTLPADDFKTILGFYR